MSNIREIEILNILDQAAINSKWPSFSNTNIDHCGARMNIFLNTDETWLIVIQWIGYIKSDGLLHNLIYVFQNYDKHYIFKPIPVSDLLTNKTLINNEGDFVGNIFDFEVVINGSKKAFKLTEQDYYNAKILNLNISHVVIICRYCVTKFSDEIFKTETEILEIIGNNNGLKPFITIKDWQHPNRMRKQLPGETESFKMIAKAIVSNDPSVFIPRKIFFNVWSWTRWDDDNL